MSSIQLFLFTMLDLSSDESVLCSDAIKWQKQKHDSTGSSHLPTMIVMIMIMIVILLVHFIWQPLN